MEATQTKPTEQNSFKSPRIRSVAYPSHSFPHCLTLTESLYKLFGNAVYIPREKIAEKTEISEGYLQTQLSSCVQHGLLELKAKEGYKPTELFIKIFRPHPSEDVRQAKIEAFKNPELYSKLIAEHNNETHTVDSLATLLFRDYKVTDNASQLAAQVFIDNAKGLGLINADNYFSIEANNAASEVEVVELPPPVNGNGKRDSTVTYLTPAHTSDKVKKSFDFPPIPIFVDDDGSVAEVYLPKGFNKAHIQKIIKVLEAQIL